MMNFIRQLLFLTIFLLSTFANYFQTHIDTKNKDFIIVSIQINGNTI